MASIEDCESALSGLAERLADVDPDLRRRHGVDRSIACIVPDLDICFFGHLRDGELRDVVLAEPKGAQIKLTIHSDDLVSLTKGELNFAGAWASGRLRIDASMMDLLRLRTLL